jgi:prefoldin alpha subunit
MPVDSPEFIESAIKVYNVEVHRAIKSQEEQLLQLQTAHAQMQQTIQTLIELPLRLRHPAMIPLGKHACLPGHLTRTNEVMVHLGEQYYVETSAAVARGILQRRLDALAQGVSKAQQQLQALRARLDVTQSSLRDDSADGGAFEIRSSIEESDALLASAASKRKQAAARQQQQQQRQGLVSRVRTAGGYSYTPLGLPEGQQQQQQPEDPDAAALQARLEELIRLEDQQEADQQDAPWDVSQQQQQQQLAFIQEGEEEDEDDDPLTAAGTSPARLPAAGSNAGVRAAAQHLQKLEEQGDSDDDDPLQHQHHQKQQQQSDAALSRVVERVPYAPQQQQHQQVKVAAAAGGAAATAAAAGTASVPGRPPLKSALKKGFFTPSSKASSGSSSKDSSTSRGHGSSSSSSGSSGTVQKSSVSAFTGAVVERPAPAADASPPAVVEWVPVAAPAPASTSSSTNSRPSKFKLRRMGLEPSD